MPTYEGRLELTWTLFLRILDAREEQEGAAAAAVGEDFAPSPASPHRSRDWAAPGGALRIDLSYPTGGANLRHGYAGG